MDVSAGRDMFNGLDWNPNVQPLLLWLAFDTRPFVLAKIPLESSVDLERTRAHTRRPASSCDGRRTTTPRRHPEAPLSLVPVL